MKTSDLVIYNDHQLICMNKPATIPIQDDTTADTSLWAIAERYTKQKLHLLTRLDRPVSGICLFQKKHAHKKLASIQLQEKLYTAIVEKSEALPEGELTHYHYKDPKRKLAILEKEARVNFEKIQLSYKTIATLDRYTALEINLLQGKFHQIRAQLSAADLRIKGDVKYGARRKNKDRSIYLHCKEIQFIHPTKNVSMRLIAPYPTDDALWTAIETK